MVVQDSYRGYNYEAVIFPGGIDPFTGQRRNDQAVWVVYDTDGTTQLRNGSIDNGTLEAAIQSARDFIDEWISGEAGPDLVPEEEQVVQYEDSGYNLDYTKSKCIAQSRTWNLDFVQLTADGYFLQDNIKGNVLSLDNNDSVNMTLPIGHKMKIKVVFRYQEAYGFGQPSYTSDKATLYLEEGDTVSIYVRNGDVDASITQGGQEKIDRGMLKDYSSTGVRHTVMLTMQEYEICSPDQGENGGGGENGENGGEDTPSDTNEILWMVLGGLVLFVIAGYVINTTSEVIE